MISDPLHAAEPGPFAPLVDPRFGLIRSLRMLPPRDDLPAGLCRAQAEVADSSRFSSWHCDDRSAGFAWDSPRDACLAAAGEAVERYCGNLVPAGLRRASFNELSAAGEAAVDPESLALFSDEQYAEQGFPFVPFTRELRALWTQGRSMVDGRPVWVPASLVWVTFFTGAPTRQEPRTHGTPYAGIAAGPSRVWAETGALFELMERDALGLAWHGGASLPRVEIPKAIGAKLRTPSLTMDFHLFPSDFGVPVIGALARDVDRDLIALGLASRGDAESAALKAAAEAVQLIVTSRILDDPSSTYMRQVAAGAAGLGVKPWRSDRSYRRLYRDDWRDVWDLLSHLQLYQDPSLREPLAERLAGSERLSLHGLPVIDRGDPRGELIRRLAAQGIEPVSVDVTTPDVADAGQRVVRVVAPGLYGNAPAAFPYLGGPRLASARAGDRICRMPVPYA